MKTSDELQAAENKPGSTKAAAKNANAGKSGAPKDKGAKGSRPQRLPYMQNRELSWLEFNKRVLDQSIDPRVPLLERLKFVSIWCSNLEEFSMVRVGSLRDLVLAKAAIYDSKTCLTPNEQLDAIYKRIAELTPVASECFRTVRHQLEDAGVHQLYPDELTPKQHKQLVDYMESNVLPLTSPQIINALHPFPHLENGALYIAVRLDEQAEPENEEHAKKDKGGKSASKAKAAEDVIMGIVPLPRNCQRIIQLDGDGAFSFILLEHALEMMAPRIFEMYPVKHANVIRVTRNADLDACEESDENDEDFRSHMKRILKKRARLGAVMLESERPLSDTTERFLTKRLNLKHSQVLTVGLPLDMGYAFALPDMVPADVAAELTNTPASPQWPASLLRTKSIIEQVQDHDVMVSYPYETMDSFVRLLQEAAEDPDVIIIKITLYRLASQSRLADALITAAENGKDVTALFELRARFDESNNIEWSQRFERAGCNIIYGFRDFKVHSKICVITRQTPAGLQFITQLGTGNYNEKTAKLYTDLSMITSDPTIGQDGALFFRNMQLEAISREYRELWVAPMMIKRKMRSAIDDQIALAKAGKHARILMKTNSVTDKEVMVKLAEASRAGVHTTMLVRGICCLLPGIKGETENIRVVSVVGRLLEHSRVYCFGAPDAVGSPDIAPGHLQLSDEDLEQCTVLLSSADLMTRNLDKRVEIAWPVKDPKLKFQVLDYLHTMLSDTAKLRELRPDGTYTDLCEFVPKNADGSFAAKPFDAQDYLIKQAYIAAERAPRRTRRTLPPYATVAPAPMAAAAAEMQSAPAAPVSQPATATTAEGAAAAPAQPAPQAAASASAPAQPVQAAATPEAEATYEVPVNLTAVPVEHAQAATPPSAAPATDVAAQSSAAAMQQQNAQTVTKTLVHMSSAPKKRGFLSRLFHRR